MTDYVQKILHCATINISEEKKDRIISFSIEMEKMFEEFIKAEGIEDGNKNN